MAALLLDYVRSIGIPCRGIASPNQGSPHVGWTTDPEKAKLAEAAGARISPYTSRDPSASGWEVSFSQGRERVTPDA